MAKTIVGALKALHSKLGGNAADVKGVKTVAGMVDKVTEQVDAGGSQSSGSPQSSGGGAFIVHISDGTLDKTFSEIAVASDSSVVVFIYEEEGESDFTYLVELSEDGEGYWVQDTSDSFYKADSEDGYPAIYVEEQPELH